MPRPEILCRNKKWPITVALIWLSVQLLSPPIVTGQTVAGWDRPVNLSNTRTQSQTPSIAADPSGGVHAIWCEEVAPGQGAIYYSRLEGEFWTTPVDVLLPPGGGITAPMLQADSAGNLHVVWASGGGIYYSQAYAPTAGSAQAWSEPQALVSLQNSSPPDIEAGEAGALYVVYAEQIGDTSGIYLVRSTDGGRRWTDPQSIYENPHSDRMVDRARLAIAPNGKLHVVWVETNFPGTSLQLGIRYASSRDGGATWSKALSLADGSYDWPEIVVRGEEEVHVVWSGTASDRFKFHRWSADAGEHWFPMWRNTALGGLQGWPALVVDGDQTLHWIQVGDVFKSTPDDSTPDKVYYQYWLNGTWSEGVVVLKGFTTLNNMNFVSAAVALGTELHVVVQVPLPETDTYQWDIFYLHRTIAARRIPAQTLTAPTIRPPEATLAVSTPTAEETRVPTLAPTPVASPNTPPSATGSTWLPLILGVAAAVVLCGITLVAVVLQRRR